MESPFFVCFRKPTTTSTIISYPIPPFTTIRGILASSLGWIPRDDLLLQEKIHIGIRPTTTIEANTEFAKILKGIAREETPFRRRFPSSPMSRQFLIRPTYQIFLSGEETMLEELSETLEDPKRPLYLGQSDDFVLIDRLSASEIDRTRTREIYSVLEGIYPKCEIVSLPYRYIELKNRSQLEFKTLSIPPQYPFDAGKEMLCYRFGEAVSVQLF